ncbi:MAG: DUF2807 domain-containing protein [Bacteroidota bacterium]
MYVLKRIATLAFLAVTVISTANAQKPVNGNGEIVEQIRPLPTFSSVLIDFSADVTIVNGETPSFRIEGDENVLPHIGTNVRGGKLRITQDRWIEPSQRVVIHIGTPLTTKLETSGYSDVVIENIEGPRLQINAGVGDVTLYGQSDRIQVRTKTGSIDATNLTTDYADVAISSHGTVKLGDVNELVTNVSQTGTVVYSSAPAAIKNRNDMANVVSVDEFEDLGKAEVSYVKFVLVNNSRKRMALRVEGPRARSFGYGFTLKASGERAENWPVGTKVYSEGRLLSDKLLITIDENMAGEKVNLFEEE